MHRPTSNPELWGAISYFFGVDLPWKIFTPTHSSPFDLIADSFFGRTRHPLVWANRSGGKTLASAIDCVLTYRFARPETKINGLILSGTAKQGENLYKYWLPWCYEVLGDLLVREPTQIRTTLKNGSLSISTATQAAVRGPKVQLLKRDEIEDIPPDIWEASVGMAADTPDGSVKATTWDTSTWHNVGGTMQTLVEREGGGFKLYKWNVWEVIEKCPPDRHENGKGCDKCPLAFSCVQKAREYHRRPDRRLGIAADQTCGLLQIDNAITMAQQMGSESWEAELECKRPALHGMVYSQFDRSTHVRGDLDFDDDLPTFRAIDFGLNNFVCLWIQEDKRGNVYVVDEFWAQNQALGDCGRKIRELDADTQIEATYVDPAGRNRNDQTGHSDVDVLNGMGVQCSFDLSGWGREVRNGIGLIRAALRPVVGNPRLFIAGKCQQLIRAFENYRLRTVNGEYIDEPIKPQPWDHPMDALRYFYVNRHRGARTSTKQLGFT